jgi:3-hydroxypropionyl-coenzyme A dehydratase
MKNVVIDLQFNDVAIIKINRPEVLNALNKDVVAELSDALDVVSNNESIKVVIITGTGERSFSAGGDINYVIDIDPIEAENYASFVHNFLNKIENLEKPVIAAINGYALGGGCQLALACDIRIASSNAKIGQTEVKMGIPPGWGGTQRLTRIVGMAKSKELIYTGKMITAYEAEEIGLVNLVVNLTEEEKSSSIRTGATETTTNTDSKVLLPQQPEQEKQRMNELDRLLNRKLIGESISLAKGIAKNSYNAVRISKTLINKGMDTDIETGLRLEIYGMALSFEHGDKQKMMSDFLYKNR